MAVAVAERSEVVTSTPAPARPGGKHWETAAVVGVLVVAGLLRLVDLDQEGFGNTYYAAAVWSMLQNLHAFVFASYDAGGFVSVDKPPVGLWIQVLSAKLLGFNGVALLLPQALAGIAAVGLLFRLVRRAFGPLAGLLASAALAVTPISVATDRNNTMDTTLVLCLLLAVWAVSVAAERGSARALLVGAALVGLGFNIKMLQAYPVVPGLALAYLLLAPLTRWRRVQHLALAGVVLLVVSLSWSVFVDLTPTAARPYVGSSGSNSAMSLALGYNGLSRLTLAIAERVPVLSFLGTPIDLDVAPGQAPGIGAPGLLRLFSASLAGQASWLLGLALVGLLVAASRAVQRGSRRRRVSLIVWGGWLLSWGGIFSFARFFHVYYLVMLGPAVAALAGIGVVELWQLYRDAAQPAWRRWLLPVALAVSAWLQLSEVTGAPSVRGWLAPLLVGGAVVCVAGLIVARRSMAASALGVGMLALLVAPLSWSVISVQNGSGGAWLPQAGPAVFGLADGGARGFGGPGGGAGRAGGGPGFGGGGGAGFAGGALTFAGQQWNRLDPGLVAYLEQAQGSTAYLVATQSSSYASLFILDSGQPAMALGGYQGWDHVLTAADLPRLIASHVVRFFYLGRAGGPVDATTDVASWVTANCAAVPAAEWQTTGGGGNGLQLYDCG